MAHRTLADIMSRLSSAQPAVESKKVAAVSVIIKGRARPRTLLIRRAESAGDPWSGQVAFPGGKMAEGDRSARQTAIRETKEEVGVDLAKYAKFAGYHSFFRTHTGDMDVIPVVFLLERAVKVSPNGEVSGHRWVGLDEFLQPSAASTYHIVVGGAARDMPAYAVGDYVVWGLTHRIISSLLGRTSA